MGYSRSIKVSILRRVLPPNNESITKVSEEMSIPGKVCQVFRAKVYHLFRGKVCHFFKPDLLLEFT